jgi:hypothetical protein
MESRTTQKEFYNLEDKLLKLGSNIQPNHDPEYYNLIEPYVPIKQDPIVSICPNNDGTWTTTRRGPIISLTSNNNPEFEIMVTVTYEDGTTEQIKACDINKTNRPIKSMEFIW